MGPCISSHDVHSEHQLKPPPHFPEALHFRIQRAIGFIDSFSNVNDYPLTYTHTYTLELRMSHQTHKCISLLLRYELEG